MPVMRKGMLIEYGLSIPPLALAFDFNPHNPEAAPSRSTPAPRRHPRRLRLHLAPGDPSRGAGRRAAGRDLLDQDPARRHRPHGQGRGHRRQFGVQPEIDTLRSMLEPKTRAGRSSSSRVSTSAVATPSRARNSRPSCSSCGACTACRSSSPACQRGEGAPADADALPCRSDARDAGDREQQPLLQRRQGPPDGNDSTQCRRRRRRVVLGGKEAIGVVALIHKTVYKVEVLFDSEAKKDPENQNKMAGFISSFQYIPAEKRVVVDAPKEEKATVSQVEKAE